MQKITIRLIPLVVVGVFNLIIFNRYFPLSEGWWEAYGYLFNLGLKPYSDFDLAFTPLFTLINSSLLHIFGTSFFNLRLFGIAVYLLATFILQIFLEQFYSARSSAIAIIVTSFLVFSEPQFIAKDYHTYQLVLVSLALLLHTWLAGNNNLSKVQQLGAALTLGAIVFFVILIKQNVGVLLFVGFLISLPLQKVDWLVERLTAFVVGTIIAAVILLPIISISSWQYVLLANDSKGSLVTVLFRFVTEEENRKTLISAIFMAVTYYIIIYLVPSKLERQMKYVSSIYAFLKLPIFLRALVAIAIIIVVKILITDSLDNSFRHILIQVSLALLFVLGYEIYRQVSGYNAAQINIKYVAIVFPMLALSYSNTNTASFDFNGMEIPVAFTVGWVLSRVETFSQQKFYLLVCLFFLAVIPRITIQKLLTPYNWWGNAQQSIFSAKYQTNYKDLDGIYVSEAYRDVYNEIKLSVDKYSLTESDVYFYNLPMFYLLHKKIPPYKGVIQWFDVITTPQMQKEIQSLQKYPPRLIVAFDPMPAAYMGHRAMKDVDRLPQEDFLDLLDMWVLNNKYRLVRNIALPTNETKQELGRDGTRTSQDFIIQNPLLYGKEIQNIIEELDLTKKGIKVLFVTQNGLSVPAETGITVKAGDFLTLQGPKKEIMKISDMIGVTHELPRNWNSVYIYIRADAI